MKKRIFALSLLAAPLAFVSCSSDNEEEKAAAATTSPVTVQYLTSVMFWYSIPEDGLLTEKALADCERYSFQRIGDKLTGTYKQDSRLAAESFTYVVNAPHVEVTFETDKFKTLVVYQLNKADGQGLKYLQIDGKEFVGMLNGIDTDTW